MKVEKSGFNSRLARDYRLVELEQEKAVAKRREMQQKRKTELLLFLSEFRERFSGYCDMAVSRVGSLLVPDWARWNYDKDIPQAAIQIKGVLTPLGEEIVHDFEQFYEEFRKKKAS